MTIDVIAYNALARSIDAKKDQIAEQRCLRDSAIAAQISLDSDIQYYQDLIDSATAYIPTIPPPGFGFTADCWTSKFYANPQDPSGWCGIKQLCDYGAVTCTFCVFNNQGGRFQCGQCCQFTVPAGITRVQFSIQAPGGPAKMTNCCGVSGHGPSGSFLQTILCVSEGDTFTICSGCAYCCYPYCCNYTLYQSCPSFVCGTVGGNPVCMQAQAVSPLGCFEMKHRICCESRDITCRPRSNNCATIWWFAHCMCSSDGNTICSNGYGSCYLTCQDCEYGCCVARLQDQPAYAYAPTTSGLSSSNMVPGSCFKVLGMWGGGCTANNCIFAVRRGVPYSHLVGCSGCGCQCVCYTNCCPGCLCAACTGQFCLAGLGGTPSLACGGGTAGYYDQGRRGEVKVAYC